MLLACRIEHFDDEYYVEFGQEMVVEGGVPVAVVEVEIAESVPANPEFPSTVPSPSVLSPESASPEPGIRVLYYNE